jgi:hypothetical protein
MNAQASATPRSPLIGIKPMSNASPPVSLPPPVTTERRYYMGNVSPVKTKMGIFIGAETNTYDVTLKKLKVEYRL